MTALLLFLGLSTFATLGGLLAILFFGHKLPFPLESQKRIAPMLGGAAFALLAAFIGTSLLASRKGPEVTQTAVAQVPAPAAPAPAALNPDDPRLQAALVQALERVATELKASPAPSASPATESPAEAVPVPPQTTSTSMRQTAPSAPAAPPPQVDPQLKATLDDGLRALNRAKENPNTDEAKAMKELLDAGGLGGLPGKMDPAALSAVLGSLSTQNSGTGPEGNVMSLLKELSQSYQSYQKGGKTEAERQKLMGLLQNAYRQGTLDSLPQAKQMVEKVLEAEKGAPR